MNLLKYLKQKNFRCTHYSSCKNCKYIEDDYGKMCSINNSERVLRKYKFDNYFKFKKRKSVTNN